MRNFIKQNLANRFRPDPKPEKVIKPKKKYSFKKKPTGEAQVFEKIWNERPHFCQICFTPIPEASPSNFMHVLAKGLNKYPKFKLNPQTSPSHAPIVTTSGITLATKQTLQNGNGCTNWNYL